MSGKLQTEEIAKNLDAEVFINCTVCNKTYKLKECLKEEPMPAPYETVIEGFLLCPGCGDRKHSYYLPEPVRFLQTRLTKSLQKWHETHATKDWRTYKTLHEKFKTAFDTAQKRYKALFGEEAKSEPRGK